MRCEGADNPPCRRCRHAGLECLFEKPTREATLTGEAGLEYATLPPFSPPTHSSLFRRIRSLETHVADIRVTQTAIQSTLLEIVAHLRGTAPFHRSPSSFSQGQYSHSPTIPAGSPSISGPPNGSHITDPNIHRGPPTPTAYHPSIPPILSAPSRDVRPSPSHGPPPHPQSTVSEFHSPQLPSTYPNPPPGQSFSFPPPSGAVLPPFSSIGAIGSGPPQPPAIRGVDDSQRSHGTRNYPAPPASKRALPPPSDLTSGDSSDIEDDDNGELPASGLVAPWEVLRGLADVAIERAAKVSASLTLNLFCSPSHVSSRRVAKRAANHRAGPEPRPLNDRIDPLKEEKFVTKFPAGWYSPMVSHSHPIVVQLNVDRRSCHAECCTRTRGSRVVPNVKTFFRNSRRN